MSLPRRIALVGFMGAGKTTVGRLLAARLGYRFVDSDDEIERRAALSVPEIFRLQGETAFREMEAAAIRDLLATDGLVLATGGGAFAQRACADEILARSCTVHLDCGFAEAVRRAGGGGNRPMLARGESAAEALYAARKDKYARAHVSIDTTARSPDDVVTEILRVLSPS